MICFTLNETPALVHPAGGYSCLAACLLLPGIVERRFNHTLHPPPHQPSDQAQALHRRLTVADLHADSLFWGRNLLHRGARGHIDIPRLAEGNVSIQAFTVVTTSPYNLNIYKNSDSTDMVRYVAIFEGWRRARGTVLNSARSIRRRNCRSSPPAPKARSSSSAPARTCGSSSPHATPATPLPFLGAEGAASRRQTGKSRCPVHRGFPHDGAHSLY